MERNKDAVDAAHEALKTVGTAVDTINTKATQLEALMVSLMHASRSADLPIQHFELALWLACDVAGDIKSAARRLG
ncbi:hypothetical protein [Paraburkholderia sp. SIMBA_054]|uniref:hypothetical protein n=1 Tax=Paraburkholderia sp. SIMBA_054 TaxID=3085795 RepID=UPI00397A7555